MKFKPWYVLLWAIVVGVGGSLSLVIFMDWTETSWIGTTIHIGVPVLIYLILRRREKKQENQ